MTIAEMERKLAEQEAWGKWNTAPLSNRIAKAKRARKSLLLRVLEDILTGALEAALLAAGACKIALMLGIGFPW